MIEGPLIPGTTRRFYLPDDDRDQRVIEREVQQGGKGLLVVHDPSKHQYPAKTLIEAYSGEDIRGHFFELNLDPMRKSDYRRGELVCVGDLTDSFVWTGDIPPIYIEVLRRNNRAARRDLKRTSHDAYRKLELEDHHARQEAAVTAEYDSHVEYAARETVKAAAPKISTYIKGT
jgi:hypothetical protein